MNMDEQSFSHRLSDLRVRKGVSAREMSLALGQNPSYINRIENRQAYPSMQIFFYICEYLDVSPAEFFSYEDREPYMRREIAEALRGLDAKQLDIVLTVIGGLRGAK